MVFSSLIFIFLFLAVNLLVYFIVPKKLRNLVLLITSLAFYGWGEPLYIVLMLFSIVIAYIFGYFVGKHRETNKTKAKIYLTISSVLNLVSLLFFKYYNFFASNFGFSTIEKINLPYWSMALMFVAVIDVIAISSVCFSDLKKNTKLCVLTALGLLGVGAAVVLPMMSGGVLGKIYELKFSLPIGISFYTFQIMSYTFDVYRGDGSVQKRLVPFAAYVTLFPQLIAGPIVRYKDIDDQLTYRTHNIDKFAHGVRTFSAGLMKKVILADGMAAFFKYLGDIAEFENTTLGAWLIVIAYTFQIYFDFSGYSDMAIGLGRMFGFEFLENFNYPYISKSITDFWRRWHMSLSTWFKDYVYIPLGGNRKGLPRQFFNIAVVWFVTGFWHGASWNYILWGVYFGVILIVEKLFLLKWLKKAPKVLAHFYALVLILVGWLIFAFPDMNEGMSVLKAMFGVGVDSFATSGVVYDMLRYLPLMLVCIVGATPLPKKIYTYLTEKYTFARYLVPVGVAASILICTAYMVDSSFSPFLYFIF